MIRDRSVRLVYLTIFLLGCGYGASLSITALHLKSLFDEWQIGTLGTWFAGGIIAMSLPAGALIRRFSAKATLILCLTLYAVSVVLFPLVTSYWAVGAVRSVDGAASVGVWVACETVLLARSDKENKALVMSVYAMAIAIGYVVGSGMARALVLWLSYREVFFVAGAIAVVSAIVVFTLLDSDAQVSQTESAESLKEPGEPTASLLWRIKTSCLATFSYGYFQAAVVLFLPIYLVKSGKVEEKDTVLITAFFAGGMLIFSSLWARLGDRIGHLRVITVLSIIGLSMILGFVFLSSWPLMCVAIFIAGATLASISPVSLALQGHIAHPRDYSRANALYNVCYGAGMLLGPPISGRIVHDKGGETMLYHFAALWLGFAVLTVVFRRDDPHVSKRAAVSRSTA